MDNEKIPMNFEFPIEVSGLEPISPTLSQGRCRIFYKYENRNGSYITDEFAEKLIATLPYAPVKGIYDEGSKDYLDHGQANRQGRIYGIVPADPHVTWETNLDEDGKERTYATCDVLVYTALYEEANEIFGKAQSMELYPPSISGEWRVYNGQRYFTFTDGCFFGLQVLGDEVEPCFEGAAFFSLNEWNELKNIAKDLKELLNHTNGGKSNMNTDEIVSSEVQAEEPVTEFAAEETPTVVEAVAEDATEFAAEEQQEEVNAPVEAPAEYEADAAEAAPVEEPDVEFKDTKEEKKDEEPTDEEKPEDGDPEEEEKPKDGEPEDTDKKDKNTCGDKDKHSLTSEEYEAQIAELQKENENYCTKISELEAQVSTLNMEKEQAEQKFTASEEKIAALTEENNSLSAFKHDIEKKQKEDIIASYAEMLNGEVIDEFTAKIDEFDAVSLDKELAYALKNTNMAAFAKAPAFIPKEEHMDALSEILSRYTK